MRTRRRLLFVALVALVASCGSRTGLLAPEESPADSGPDVFHRDAAKDATEEDVAEEDVLPPIDVSPPVDVQSDCPDAASTLIYVISSDNNLYSFYPPASAFTLIGTIACPVVTPGDEPFSMAVDRNGIAYVVFSNPTTPALGGELFRVSTATAACEATTYVVDQNPAFHTFGMGFSKDATGTGETLYLAGDTLGVGSTPSELGSLDVTTFKLTDIGTFNPTISGGELTGTGAGDLFSFYGIDPAGDMAIGQIDKTNAAVVGQTDLPGVQRGQGWAFGFWGGDFYTFTAPNGVNTVVTRYRPSDGSIVQVAAANDIIVGAGVSTCAPQQ
jgi:hypothetical protein